jgi:RNA polymerase sigma-70 factor (ECF subfamily)
MMKPMEPDLELVRRLLAGDEAAFADFFDRSFPPLFRFALRRTGGDPDAAEEIAQAALARAVSRLRTYRGEATLLTWLTTFCRHEIAAWYEQRSRRPPEVELLEDRPDVRAVLESLGAELHPDAAVARREVADRVRTILDALPGRYADALEWKSLDGLSVADIARRLGLSTKAAESLLTRAREAFREAFATLGEEPVT